MTGWKTWAALEEVTAANMNSYVRDQTIQVFATTAARDAAIVAPTRGLVCLITNTGLLQTYYGSTTGWKRPWATPWGTILQEETNTTQTQTGASELTIKQSSSFTATADRLYRVTMSGTFYQTVGTDVFNLRLKDGTGGAAPELMITRHGTSGGGQTTVTMSTVAEFTAGTHTVSWSVQRVTGTGTGGSLSGLPCWFEVTDIGPATLAAPAS